MIHNSLILHPTQVYILYFENVEELHKSVDGWTQFLCIHRLAKFFVITLCRKSKNHVHLAGLDAKSDIVKPFVIIILWLMKMHDHILFCCYDTTCILMVTIHTCVVIFKNEGLAGLQWWWAHERTWRWPPSQWTSHQWGYTHLEGLIWSRTCGWCGAGIMFCFWCSQHGFTKREFYFELERSL